MDRSLLEKMLRHAPGIEAKDEGFTVAEDHRATLYLAVGMGTTPIGEIVALRLHEGFIDVEGKDRTHHLVRYENVFGVAVRPPREDARTGF